MGSVTRTVEDYLTIVWKAEEWPGGEATTSGIAATLGVTPSTVSAGLKKLARDGLIDYEPYGAPTLTARGRAIAVAVVRRHRLIETYLAERLDLGWDEVHEEADLLEHAVSDRLLARIDAALGHPVRDPHGDPIPGPDGAVPPAEGQRLVDAAPGLPGVVLRVSDREPAILRHLASSGLVPGAAVEVLRGPDATGSVEVRVAAGAAVVLPTAVAAAVRVAPPA